MESGLMAQGRRNARRSKKPLTPEQKKFEDEMNAMLEADSAQSSGMKNKADAWKQVQDDKKEMVQAPLEYKGETLKYVGEEEVADLKRNPRANPENTPFGTPEGKRVQSLRRGKPRGEDGIIDKGHRIAA